MASQLPPQHTICCTFLPSWKHCYVPQLHKRIITTSCKQIAVSLAAALLCYCNHARKLSYANTAYSAIPHLNLKWRTGYSGLFWEISFAFTGECQRVLLHWTHVPPPLITHLLWNTHLIILSLWFSLILCSFNDCQVNKRDNKLPHFKSFLSFMFKSSSPKETLKVGIT